MLGVPEAGTLETQDRNDLFSNGRKWNAMFLLMIELCKLVSEAQRKQSANWQPCFPNSEWENSSSQWLEIQAGYKEAIINAVRELIQARQVQHASAEVLYFLGLRCRVALNFIEITFIRREDRPQSPIPFPAMAPDDVAEWFLTEWGEDESVYLAFPEMLDA